MEDSEHTSSTKIVKTSSDTSTSSSLSLGDLSSEKTCENKENMSRNTPDHDSVESLNLRLEETQQEKSVDEDEDNHEEVKWSEKLNRSLDKEKKLKFHSSSSGSPLASKSLDQSVIIEDSPNDRNISIINISDSSVTGSRDDLHLVLDDTPKHSDQKIDESQMSEILASNSLLYQEFANIDNLDNVIDNDEDLQSMDDNCLLDKEVVR